MPGACVIGAVNAAGARRHRTVYAWPPLPGAATARRWYPGKAGNHLKHPHARPCSTRPLPPPPPPPLPPLALPEAPIPAFHCAAPCRRMTVTAAAPPSGGSLHSADSWQHLAGDWTAGGIDGAGPPEHYEREWIFGFGELAGSSSWRTHCSRLPSYSCHPAACAGAARGLAAVAPAAPARQHVLRHGHTAVAPAGSLIWHPGVPVAESVKPCFVEGYRRVFWQGKEGGIVVFLHNAQRGWWVPYAARRRPLQPACWTAQHVFPFMLLVRSL